MPTIWTFETLAGADHQQLDAIVDEGRAPLPRDVAGFEFRGWNLNPMTALLGTRKFKKGFYRAAGSSRTWGYNVRVRQNSFGGAWSALPSDANPKRFYFFGVQKGASADSPQYPRSLVVDYRLWPDTPHLDPVRYTVDYLVFANDGNRDLLVGKSYSENGPLQLLLGFFILERHNPTSFAGG